MTKRLSSKLLAVILTIAICATTVLGCLIAASAADSCYAFGVATFAEDDLTQATMDVTFTKNDTVPYGFSAGAFTVTEVDADSEDYLVVKSVVAAADGINLTNEGDYYIFDSEDVFDSVTFTLTFGFSQGEASEGTTYKVKLTDVELAHSNDAYFVQSDSNGAIGEITTSCNHSVTVVGDPVATGVGGDYGYSVYEQSVCVLCGEQFGYQLVPTAEVLSNDSEGTTIQWDGSSKTAPTEGSGTEADPYIISDVAHLAYITEAGPDVTHGKYYKVADGIKNIVLQSAADAETLINLDSAEEVKTYISGLSGRSNWGSSKYDAATAFAGFFDGNGATVYGLSASASRNISLFGSIGPKAEFKNLSIKNSFVQTGWYAATLAHAVQGYTLEDGTAVATGTVKIDNCTFANNYLNPQSGVNGGTAGNQCIGVILGNFNSSATGSGLAINKVMTYGNITFYEQQQANISPLIGMLNSPPAPTAETETEYCELMDCILLDIPGDIFASNNSNFKSYYNVQNVYTDSTWVATYLDNSWYNTNDANTVTKAQMLGSGAATAAPNLAWGSTWLLGDAGELPRLAPLDYVSDTIYWDGSTTKTAPTVGSGTKEDPFIISTVAELAYVAGQTSSNDNLAAAAAVTFGKYYKIADGIKNIVMQPYTYGNDIMALGSAADVKTYFEANAANMKTWLYYGWEGSTFCGDIDFNGATVYGIYQVSTNNIGLFSNADAGAAFHNLAIKNSYMTSSATDYQAGAIAAVGNGSSYARKANGVVWAENCTVANNYMYSAYAIQSSGNARVGVLFGGFGNEAIYLDNILVYGNDATYDTDSKPMPLIGLAGNTVDNTDEANYPADLEINYVGTHNTTGLPLHGNMVRNSIILGCDPYNTTRGSGSRFNDVGNIFVKVYTDADIENDTFSDGVAVSKFNAEEKIGAVTASDVLGVTAEVNMPNLTWGTDWFAAADGEYPAQSAFVTPGVANASNADFEVVGTNIVYEDDGSFSLNIHYIPAYTGFTPTMYVGDTNCTKLYVLQDPVASSKRDDIGDDTAMMFTLSGISAKNIDKLWHPTLVAQQGASIDWSQSVQISVAENATAIIEGDYDTADKNVASAVLLYGDASQAALAVTSSDYSAGVIDLLEFGSYLTDMGSSSQYYDTVVADNGETGDSWDDPIIIDSAEEFVYIAKTATNDTDGKYYKVADGIAGFDLSKGNLDLDGTLADNLAKVQASGKNHSGGTPGFQGHFDGNGVTIYGAWCSNTSVSAYAGLFSCAQGDVTIKNVNVKFASFTATTAVGGIVGYYKGEGNYSDNTTLTIENCSITESHLETTGVKAGSAVGAIVGRVDCPSGYTDTNDEDGDGSKTNTVYVNNKVNVKNCFVDLDEEYFISPGGADGVDDDTNAAGAEGVMHGGVVSYCASNALMVSECVVIGVTPYPVTDDDDSNNIQHSGHANNFSNVYTDQEVSATIKVGGTTNNGIQDLTAVMTQLTTAELTGIAAKQNMTALDWINVWTTTDGYPTFINKDYVAPASGLTIYWDGTVASGFASGTGTKEDPYIIATASQLAYLVKDNATVSPDKYFKVADGISNIVLQSADYADDIIALGSAADTKTYFEANAASLAKWPNYAWEASSFCGYFDGNGATVYGLYQTSANNAGLFSSVDAGAAITNIALKNSYLTSTATNYQVAGIVAVANGNDYGVKQAGVIWVNGCTVANCYMYNSSTEYARSGVIAGNLQNDIIMIDNCLTYGNDATYGDGVKMSAYGDGSNNVATTAKKPAELPSYVENSGYFCNTVRNSIILDCDAMNTKCGAAARKTAGYCYVNVYTNGTSGTLTFGSYTYTYTGITSITAADIMGDNAADIVKALNAAAIGDTVWYVGATGDYPGFKEAGALNSGLQALYDGIVLTPDTYNDTGVPLFSMYATSVNLNSNPYMSFAFEFGGELKENRDQITVTFTYTVNGTEYTHTTTPPEFTGDGTINGTDGWYNRPSAGRFHTYRFTGIPVEALANPIKVSANYDGTDYDLGSFSVAGLAYEFECQNKLTPSDYYATRIEAVKALLFYTQMIHARYGAQ